MRTFLEAAHRPDYAKFLFRGPVDLCEQYKLRFIELISSGEEFDGPDSGYVAKPLRRHNDGNWTYVFELYGPLAQVVKYFDWKTWSAMLERFDVKFDLDLTNEGVLALRSHLETYGAAGRNVHTFNSRIRTKKDGRDAGGFGVAVGSHKSHSRLSAYKRGKERGGVEFQLTGKPVGNAVAVINMLRGENHEQATKDPWAEFSQQLFVVAVKDYEKSMKLSFSEMCGVLTEKPSDSVVERALAAIEKQVAHLDRTGLEVVRAMVQEQLSFDFAA